MKTTIKNLAIILTITLLFQGCSNKEVINPSPDEVKPYNIKEKATQNLYQSKGYNQGKFDGFNEGVKWANRTTDKFMEKIHAIQFSSYLYKNKFIQPGPVYISQDGRIVLSKMEVRPPYTKAEIFNEFGAKLPKYITNHQREEEYDYLNPSKTEPKIQLPETSFTPDIFSKKAKTKILNNNTRKKVYATIRATKTNKDLILKYGLNAGIIDNNYVAKFDTKKDAIDFCSNINICSNLNFE